MPSSESATVSSDWQHNHDGALAILQAHAPAVVLSWLPFRDIRLSTLVLSSYP